MGGTNKGTENTDYIMKTKANNEVQNVTDCMEQCEHWETDLGADKECYGIEAATTGGDHLDYCEFWLKKPMGKTDSNGHVCHIYDEPADAHDGHDHGDDHGDDHDDDHAAGAKGTGAQEANTAAAKPFFGVLLV